jgi:hypothetical protein
VYFFSLSTVLKIGQLLRDRPYLESRWRETNENTCSLWQFGSSISQLRQTLCGLDGLRRNSCPDRTTAGSQSRGSARVRPPMSTLEELVRGAQIIKSAGALVSRPLERG